VRPEGSDLDDELDLDRRAQGQGDAADGGPGVLAKGGCPRGLTGYYPLP
jgi:hypothetical protein